MVTLVGRMGRVDARFRGSIMDSCMHMPKSYRKKLRYEAPPQIVVSYGTGTMV
jgi:hypothetical protein